MEFRDRTASSGSSRGTRRASPSTALGFREVGVYRRHGKLGDEWKDVVIVERLLAEARG